MIASLTIRIIRNEITRPLDVLVQYVASTFVLVLNWWVETDSRLTPNEVNNLFRALVVPILATG